MKSLGGWRLHTGKVLLGGGASLVLAACGGNYGGGVDAAGGGSSGAAPASNNAYPTPEAYFAANVEPNLGYCRTCHVPGGAADIAGGNLFLLDANPGDDYNNTDTAWSALGKGVDSNLLLQNPSGQHTHTGGSPWPVGSAGYIGMQTMLSCWNSGCNGPLGSGSGGPAPLPDDSALRAYFTANVEPNLGYCRICHVPGGLPTKPYFIEETGRLFLLSSNTADDYTSVQAAWMILGKGVDENLMLRNPGGKYAHLGLSPWPVGDKPYEAMRTVLACWDDPGNCSMISNAGGSSSGGGSSGSSGGSSSSGGGLSGAADAALRSYFAANLQPYLGYCRGCHVPGGLPTHPYFIDEPGSVFLLSADKAQDYDNVYAEWVELGLVLGEGVNNRLLRNPSGQYIHLGLSPWPVGSPAYEGMKTMLTCWNDPGTCPVPGVAAQN
ncbi:MAG: hypothetical protein P4L83_06945 [Nevskia sp.]|nr:hypothetical protein [Nevskia sp.]